MPILDSTWSDVYEVQNVMSSRSIKFNTIQETKFEERYGAKVVDTEFIPYMRSRVVRFTASGMKPNTRLYAFFDGVSVNEYCSTSDVFVINGIGSAALNDTGSNPADADPDGDGIPNYYGTSVTGKVIHNNPDTAKLLKQDPRIYLHGITSGHKVRVVGRWRTEPDVSNGVVGMTDDELGITCLNIITSETEFFEDGEIIVTEYSLTEFEGNPVNPETRIPLGYYKANSWVPNGAADVRTDAAGNVSGLFKIPNDDNLKFRTGERIFRLTDQPNDSSNFNTSAQTVYVARGLLNTTQETMVNVRSASFASDDVGTETKSHVRANFMGRQVDHGNGWFDPLAQTFETKPNWDFGMFISRVSIYFQSKPVTVKPEGWTTESDDEVDVSKQVKLQIRNTLAGVPGMEIYAEKELNPWQVSISDDGSIETYFTFKHPVWLRGEGTQCAIVLISDCDEYNVHVSRLGEEDLISGDEISTQPYLGVFFKSQNQSTWHQDQLEDMKFRIWRAKFNTNAHTILAYDNVHWNENEYEDEGVDYFTIDNMNKGMPPTSMHITEGSPLVIFTLKDHDLYDELQFNSRYYVAIAGFKPNTLYGGTDSQSAISGADINGVHIVCESSLDTFTIDVSKSKMNYYPANSLVTDGIRQTFVVGTTNRPETSGSFSPISNIPYDRTQPLAHTDIARVYVNSKYDVMLPKIERGDGLEPCKIEFYFKGTTGSSQHSSTQPGIRDLAWRPFVPNTITPSPELRVPGCIYSFYNENLYGNTPSLQWRLLLSTTDDMVSPTIDNERISCSAISNRLNNPASIVTDGVNHGSNSGERGYVSTPEGFVSELEPQGGSISAKYITKEIKLKTPASSLRIALSVHRPLNSNIFVYYKLRQSDSEDYRELRYNLAYPPVEYYDIISGPDLFTDVSMDIGLDDPMPEFIAFGIKITLQGDNTCDVPRVKDLRVIATA
jgi:hypothetical protein